MIFTERTIRIINGSCDIDNPILLYRGDFNVEIRFTIIDCPYKYTTKDATNVIESTNASYGQLVIKTPNGDPIFSDVTATNEGAIVFTITGDMIDETIELGDYDFQIRLFDAERTSRATICPVTGGIKVEEPIAIEGGSSVISDTNEVNVAQTNYAITTTATPLDVFDEDGNYIETTWTDKMLITDARLNKIEDGITGVNAKAVNAINSIPTATSQLTNDSDFATETYVTNAIANAQLGGSGGEVDLSGYVTKEVGNASQITFSDGETFQAKLEAGTLRGADGAQGERGADGLTTAISVNGTTYNHSDGTITLPDYPTVVTAASGITIADTANNFTATNVEGALQEVGSQVKDIENQIKETGSPTDEQVSNAINSAIEQGLITGSITKTSVTANDTFTIKTSSESGGETGGENTPVIYNIINTLTNCINSNTATNIEENSSYTGTISANEGYTLGTPVITMGGVDITNSAYSNGTITISNVTGNIVITCSANEGFDLSKYLVATGYSVTSKSVAYSVMRFAADSKYNVYSFPVKASRYKLTATNVYSSGTYWLNQAEIDAMSTDQLATTTSSVTVNDGVPVELSATFTPASSYEYEGYISIDGGYLYTCYVEFASEGNLIVACNPALNPTIEEVN